MAIEAMSAGLLPVLHKNDAYKALAENPSDADAYRFFQSKTAADALAVAFARLEVKEAQPKGRARS